jgi:glycyl-tRNA synthetase
MNDKAKFQEELARYLADKDYIYGPEPEIYEPMAGFYSYGLLGKELKNKVEAKIRKVFVKNGFFEVEFPIIAPEIVWKASGHLDGFNDPVIVCSKCKASFRADKLIEEKADISADSFTDEQLINAFKENEINCPSCKGRFNLEIERHSLMMKTTIGKNQVAYNRPETATTTYLPFKRYAQFFRNKLPFTVFQIGKAFRNEISPRQHLLRMREFTQAEAQIFLSKEQKNNWDPFELVKKDKIPLWTAKTQEDGKEDWTEISLEEAIEKKYLKNKAYAWSLWLAHQVFISFGIEKEYIRYRQHQDHEKAFYADDAWDLEIKLNSFGWTECCGVHDRASYDLTQHEKFSKQKLVVRTEEGEIRPDVIEIAFGVDRPYFALLDLAFFKREGDEKRTVLSLPAYMSPLEIGVLPLVKKDGLPEKAKEVLKELDDFRVYYDATASIGKRYSRLDSVGVPFCITIDHDSLKDNSVTVRERDSLKQSRVKISELNKIMRGYLNDGFKE